SASASPSQCATLASSHQSTSFGIDTRCASLSRNAFIAASLSHAVRVQKTNRPSANTAPAMKPAAVAACAEIALASRANAGSVKSERKRKRVIELNAMRVCSALPITGKARPGRLFPAMRQLRAQLVPALLQVDLHILRGRLDPRAIEKMFA